MGGLGSTKEDLGHFCKNSPQRHAETRSFNFCKSKLRAALTSLMRLKKPLDKRVEIEQKELQKKKD